MVWYNLNRDQYLQYKMPAATGQNIECNWCDAIFLEAI